MNFEQAAGRVQLGRSVAFFGAGFSREARNVRGKLLKDAGGLADELAAAAGEVAGLSLKAAAQAYEDSSCKPLLPEVIRATFSTQEITSTQALLATLPWSQIYTTNYDDVIERAVRNTGGTPNSLVATDAPPRAGGFRSVVHLHGFVERMRDDDWEQTVVLTDVQYAADILNRSNWPERFRSDVSYADSIFFFGYSLRDIDISRLLYQDPALRDKTYFVVGDSPDADTRILLKRYGTVITSNISDVAALFGKKSPALKSASFPASFKRWSPPADVRKPTKDEIKAHLVKGDARTNLIAYDLINATTEYYVPRTELSEEQLVPDSGYVRVIIHSRLGNGKTDALVELSHNLTLRGWDVLEFSGDDSHLGLDIDYFASLGTDQQSKTMLLIENAFSYSRTVKQLLERFPSLSFVLTLRSAALQTRIADLAETFGDDFSLVDLSGFDDDELRDLDDLIFDAGLWGERQGDDQTVRLEYMRATCRRDLATILVAVCESSDIFARLRTELGKINDQPAALKRLVLATLAAAIAGVSNISISQICEIAQSDLFKLGSQQSNPAINEFIDFQEGRVSARSPAFAKAVLRDIVPDAVIVESIPDLLERLARLRRIHRVYNDIYKSLMRFNIIESVITSDDKHQKITAFYENVRSLKFASDDPQFWLQYAIASLDSEDFKSAEDQFESAFSLARRRGGYDPFQIENHYARFLLESRTKTDFWSDFFDAFSEANDIVQRQIKNFREGFYPYRVARLYLPYIDAHVANFSVTQLDTIGQWCKRILSVSDDAPETVRASVYWDDCRSALSALLDILQEEAQRKR